MSQQVESITLTEWRHATPLVVQDGNDGPLDPQTDKYKLLNHIIRIAIKMYDSDTGQHALGWVAQSVVNKMRPDQHFPDYATGGSTPPEGNTRSPAERQMHAIGNLVPAFMEKIEKSFFAIHLTDDIPVLELVPLGHEASPRHGEAKAEPTFNGNLLSHYDAESAGTIKVGKTFLEDILLAYNACVGRPEPPTMPLDMQELKFYHGAVYLAWRIADEMLHMFVNLVTGSSTAVPAVLSLGKYSTWAELMIRYDFQSKYVLMALPGTSHHCRVGIIYKGWFRADDFTIDPLTLAQVKRVWNYDFGNFQEWECDEGGARNERSLAPMWRVRAQAG